MASDEQVATVLKAAIDAQMPTGVKALDPDEHQGLKARHIQFGCARRYVPAERAGLESVAAFRATTRVVASTVSNARELQRRVDLAFRGVPLSIEARNTSPIRRESQDQPEADEGLYSALTVWTFTH